MSDVGRFYSYHHIKSISFTIVTSIAYLIICMFVFDLGLLGVKIELDVSLEWLTLLLTDPTIYIPIAVLASIFVYNLLKNKRIDSIAIIDKKYLSIMTAIFFSIGVALMVYGYLDSSIRGPLWVMLGVILHGVFLIQLLSYKLFKLNSNCTKEDYNNSILNFGKKNILVLLALILFTMLSCYLLSLM